MSLSDSQILASAAVLSHVEYKALAEEQRRLSVKGTLSVEDIERLQELVQRLMASAYYQPGERLIGLRGQGPEDFQTYVQDKIWEHLWWADHMGYDAVEHIESRPDLYGPNTLEAVRASSPLPEGWLPPSRRR